MACAIAGVVLAGVWLVNGGLGATAAYAQGTALHGIAFSKGCQSPINVGAPYTCTYKVVNDPNVNNSLDTLTFNAISDTVHASPADVSSGPSLRRWSSRPTSAAPAA